MLALSNIRSLKGTMDVSIEPAGWDGSGVVGQVD